MSFQSFFHFLNFLVSCLYFFLPAYFANMAPPLGRRFRILESLALPVDFNKKIFKKPIFGSHKTWRGVTLSFLVGFSTSFFQKYLYRFSPVRQISILDYSKINIWLFAFLISLGTISGDLGFAFLKRRLNLPPGAPFLPFDQTNYVIGNAIFLSFFFKISFSVWITLFIFTFFLHAIVNRIGYHLKIHQAKW